MLKHIFFDFDGTLVDTSEGIIKAMHYAFEQDGRNRIADAEVRRYIGPPLNEMFECLWQTKDDADISRGVKLFRTYYAEHGVEECCLYGGVPEMLAQLVQQGYKLYIVSSKPAVFIEKIAERYGIRKYFTAMTAVGLQVKDLSKAERMGMLMKENNILPEETVMIGDRPEDILAAKANSVRAIGVTYGFGTDEELRAAGAWNLASSLEEVLGTLRDFVGIGVICQG